MSYLYASIIGLVSGVISGLFGVGGGIVMVPAMFNLMNVPIKTAIGTSLLIIIPTACTGAYKHYVQGNIDWKVALAIVPLAVVGGYFGAKLTSVIPAEKLRMYFGIFIILVGFRMVLSK